MRKILLSSFGTTAQNAVNGSSSSGNIALTIASRSDYIAKKLSTERGASHV